jgi:hypothetical protein
LAGKNREEVHLQRGVTEKQCCVDLENIAMTHTANRIINLLYKCPEEHRFQAAGKEREKD